MTRRDVATIRWTSVHSPTVGEHTPATTVSRSTLLSDVVLAVQSPLHLNWCHHYLANHPYQVWCNKLFQGIELGIDIKFEGKRTSIISDNWKYALDHPEVVTQYITNEVAAGHKGGPYTKPPFPDFV